jgi:hypothetical protein
VSEGRFESKPYKGPLSYEIEDAAYFFGRDREADLLTAKILSSRFTLLHAQSGTGKTSLLNARVLPAMEEQGWAAFRILPRHNPTEAVRLGALIGLLPPPAAEGEVLTRVLRQFWNPGEDPTLGEMLDRFDHLVGTCDPRRREALQPVQHSLNVKGTALAFSGSFRPLLLRLLRATLEISQYEEHLKVLVPDATELSIHDNTRASELLEFLSDPKTADGHENLVARVYTPAPSLREFFSNLVEIYGRKRTQFRLVLILDQFEELFTLFSDTLNAPEKQLWRLRWEFIQQLEDLYEAGGALPLRYVISMRDEYIAQLDPLRRFVRDLDASAFHLSFLEKEEARASIREPAHLFGYDYSQECYSDIFEALLREDRFVEPAPLQIVCEKLWQEQGKALATVEGGDERRVIELAAFPRGGTRAILDSFFDETLQSLESRIDQLETLEMLEPLVTSNGTRNIVEYNYLVNAPFRKGKRRSELLEKLAQQRIVRIEQRLGGQFVEITHEFLIASILVRIRTVLNPDPEYGRLRWAIRTLERFEDVDFRAGSAHVLTRQVFYDLDRRADEIGWNEWSTELMLRSAIVLGAEQSAIQPWAQRYRESGYELDPAAILTPERIRDRARSLLSAEELAVLNDQDSSELTAEQIEFAFRSQIRQTRDREEIVRWTKELKRVCDNEALS